MWKFQGSIKKEVEFPEVFMKNLRNFHESFFLTVEFFPTRVSNNFIELAGVKACFLKSKVANLIIFFFFFFFLRKVYTGVKTRENFLIGHKFTMGRLIIRFMKLLPLIQFSQHANCFLCLPLARCNHHTTGSVC